MKRAVQKTLVLAVGIVVGSMLIAACEEEQNIPGKKKGRLIAAENMQLKEQIEKQKRLHDKEMEKQKDLYARETKKQKKLLDKCLQEKKTWEEVSSQGVKSLMGDLLGPVIDENTKLGEENKTLKEQVKELQEQKANLEAEIRRLEKEREEVKKQTGSKPL